jgi:hypothetical protein
VLFLGKMVETEYTMPNVDSTVNQRKHQRHRVLKEGKIVSSAMDGAINVTIRDLSVGGARIHVLPYIEMPKEFSLLVTSENLLYPAIAKWRTGEVTGIAFVGEPFRGSALRHINALGA